MLAEWRKKKGLDPNPMAAYRASGYEAKVAKEREASRAARGATERGIVCVNLLSPFQSQSNLGRTMYQAIREEAIGRRRWGGETVDSQMPGIGIAECPRD
jgi:hypothetical protein